MRAHLVREASELEAEIARLRVAANGWYELAHALEQRSDAVQPLLRTNVDAWSPAIFQGQSAETGHDALIDQRQRVTHASDDLFDDAEEARRRARAAERQLEDTAAALAGIQRRISEPEFG